MRIDSDGSLWAINPETGFFGVAPGTNSRSNPNAVATIKKNTIFTNVLLKPDKTVWWEDADGPMPKKGTDWMGRPWRPGILDDEGKAILGAHSNSRFTAPLSQCPSVSFRLEHHHGVPISAILFGGRRAHLAPLVYEAFNWQHGVYVGATMASERTSAQFGKLGEVRFDPMAMLPFCGYNMADYFQHWLKIGKEMTRPPRIFYVNWFRLDKNGKFLWPGFGENLRILEWILKRCNNEVGAIKTAIGHIPKIEDINLEGLNLSKEIIKELFAIDREQWREELRRQGDFLNIFGDTLPPEIWQEYADLEKRLA
jgi:phosphoenolpyruvate carboxykinase (GTP)